jgi:hypothetical protein
MSILQQLNIQENWLLKEIKTRKLKYFGHIKRHNGLEKIILEGVVPGRRGQGRPRKQWVQDVMDELGMTASDARHLAQDRENFRAGCCGSQVPNGTIYYLR